MQDNVTVSDAENTGEKRGGGNLASAGGWVGATHGNGDVLLRKPT